MIELVQGDIATARADAIVSGTDTTLLGGAVAEALRRVAGPGLMRACRLLGAARVGEARTTGAFGLDARIVIHAVAPGWKQGVLDAEPLVRLHRTVFELAAAHGCETVALPALGTGGSGWPVHIVAEPVVAAIDAAIAEGLIRAATLYLTESAYTAFDRTLLIHQPLPLRPVRRGDWQLAPWPPLRPIPFTRTLDAAQTRALSRGRYPQEMEDKWFVYRDGGQVLFHRSWTGNLTFRVAIDEAPDGSSTLADALLNADPEQCTATDEEATQMLGHLVDALASR